MQNNTITQQKKKIAIDYDGDEQKIYLSALEAFKHGPTYQNTPDP